MNIIVNENKVMYRLITAFILVLLGAVWIISSLSNVSYKVEDNMSMLVQDHLPKLDTIYTLQTNVKALELILYNYYETTDSLVYQTKWRINQQKINKLLGKLDTTFVNEVNQYLVSLNSIAQAFDIEMKHPETDWDELRNQLVASTKVSDEFNLVLSEHTKSLRDSFKHYSDNTESLIAKMVISQIAFSVFVLLLLGVLAFILKGMLKQHKINRELALYPEQNPYPIMRLDKNESPIYLNPAALKLAQSLNCVDAPSKLLPTVDKKQMFAIKSDLDSYKSNNYSLGNRMFSAIFHHTNTDDSVYAYLIDVTDRVKAENDLIHRSNHDLLTGLPNRRNLEESLKVKTLGPLNSFTLVFLKVSGLDLVNASLGHEMSDKVLQAMSQRLESFVNHASDSELSLYSFESSSWVIICNNSATPLQAKQLGDDLVRLFLPALIIGDFDLSMQCGVGLTTFPQGGVDAEQLLRNADAALRQGIKEGASVRLYSEELTEQATRSLALEQGLKHALEKGEFILNIQPKVDAQTQQIVGGEILIRWKYNDVFISPAEFIPLAEESDLIIGIGEWVLSTACAQWVKWSDEGLEPKKLQSTFLHDISFKLTLLTM